MNRPFFLLPLLQSMGRNRATVCIIKSTVVRRPTRCARHQIPLRLQSAGRTKPPIPSLKLAPPTTDGLAKGYVAGLSFQRFVRRARWPVDCAIIRPIGYCLSKRTKHSVSANSCPVQSRKPFHRPARHVIGNAVGSGWLVFLAWRIGNGNWQQPEMSGLLAPKHYAQRPRNPETLRHATTPLPRPLQRLDTF